MSRACTSPTETSKRSRGSTCTSTAARSSPCSDRTARARPPPWRSSKASGRRPPAAREVLGHDPGRHEQALTERIGIVLQSTGVDPYLTVQRDGGALQRLLPEPTPARRGHRAGRAGFEGGHPGAQALRRAAASPGRRDRAGRRPGAAVPRRADDRVRSQAHATPRGTSSRASPNWARRCSSRRTSWTRRSSSPTGSPCWPGARSSPRARRPRSLGATGCWRRIQFRVDGDAAPISRRWGRNATSDGTWTIRAEDPTRPLHELTGWAIEHGVTFDALEVTRPSLEDVYLEITGGEVVEVE